ncbi:HPP family protein [Picrophilus oshimae]|uniref:HPP family protein n=1 Tax=Picrophilus torridus (strain ATCC 700027 / DSM 9790 / JCM 10055 / NBRC 100828 / KAW 2/3) TaxID=1122961 RepID=A0A8G2FXP1_PICTO|nr:HPP family protein [Picrophilus oshimae]SMD31338.1 HPP family protein [Picrophilus oshimae DSM 9789]
MYYKNHEEFIRNKMIPALFVGITIAITIFLLHYFYNLVIPIARFIIFGSFASSAFLLFMEPENKSSKLMTFIRSYIIAGIIGLIVSLLTYYINIYYSVTIVEFILALALVSLRAEHPPAMGIDLVYVIEKLNIYSIIFVVLGALIIASLDKILEKFVYIERRFDKNYK